MPNFTGMWTSRQQMQARGANTWPALPGAPTSVSATGGNAQATVSFTAPADTGYPASIVNYTVVSNPGGITAIGVSSPITVTGLSNFTAYTFTVIANNDSGPGTPSAASNSVTPTDAGQQAYTTAGTYSWVAPSGVTSVSVVAVGGGGAGSASGGANKGGGGGGLGWKNNISVTPGNSYTVVVGSAGAEGSFGDGTPGGNSHFINTSTVLGGGGQANTSGVGGTYAGDGGGNGGNGGIQPGGYGSGGGGAGGYTGNGGNGGRGGSPCGQTAGTSGVGGAGGGGGGAGSSGHGGSGGGVGILGQGSNGSGGASASGSTSSGGGGGGGSGGANGGLGTAYSPGGAYGGGGSNAELFPGYRRGSLGGVGAVRIIWPGTTRQFPSTNTGNL